ncbi:hypothetical protein DUNSADRAFT_7677 [Dunaliella salina]|uniref:Uncharacterized protein n=1 Tax=Dunaliella salina TaxID=3046 RepID=A0ABQ7H675_DUNSA|nr:hypothetical protein DUNSADRAFT_7677 [Dunaliella salina]|eukprot:KAF5842363.1 hypothetical protein DUNSADRAFT_7677 [Dunaliella salina]
MNVVAGAKASQRVIPGHKFLLATCSCRYTRDTLAISLK